MCAWFHQRNWCIQLVNKPMLESAGGLALATSFEVIKTTREIRRQIVRVPRRSGMTETVESEVRVACARTGNRGKYAGFKHLQHGSSRDVTYAYSWFPSQMATSPHGFSSCQWKSAEYTSNPAQLCGPAAWPTQLLQRAPPPSRGLIFRTSIPGSSSCKTDI